MEQIMSGDGLEAYEAEQERIAEEARMANPENKRLQAMFLLGASQLAMAVPGGKSLQEKTEALLGKAHIKIHQAHPRSVSFDIRGFPGLTRGFYFKPNQIPGVVADGVAALGLTGNDVLAEYEEAQEHAGAKFSRIEICAELPYSRLTSGPTKAVLFTKVESEVNSIRNVQPDEVVASEYPMATAKLFAQNRIPVSLIECTGSAESLVVAGKCRYGVTLTETGDTLRANGLKVIATVFESNTVLIANKAALDNESIRKRIAFLARKLTGVLGARDKVYLLMNVPAEKVEEVCEYLQRFKATLRRPTVSPLFNGGMFCSVATVVNAENLNVVEMRLTELGADGFVELDPDVVM